MPSLSDLQTKFHNADIVAGTCVCFHEGRHYELGKYVGDGMVVLGPEGEKLLESLDSLAEEAEVVEVRRVPRAAKKRGVQVPTDINDDLTKLDL